jgi:alpha-tubulin suppressor-like RCC1 family protein
MELHVSGVTQRLFCWGDNQYGQLGDGTFLSSSTPVAVMYQNVQQGPLAVGHDHNCYFPWEAPRTVHCWGWNDSGQLGNGSTGNQPTPGLLYNPVNLQYKEIVAGGQHTCGVIESNDVYCWGNNGRGQLGIGDMIQKTTPAVVEVPDLSENNVLSITAGGEHTCAVFSPSADYRLYCWGPTVIANSG